MGSPNVKLTYFNARARGEQLRWILVQAGVKFDDIRIEQEDWPKLKPKTPTGALPFLTIGSSTLSQTAAIAMFAGHKHNMLGSTAWEAANIHMLFESAQEFLNARSKLIFVPDEETKKKLTAAFVEETLPPFLNLLRARLVRGDQWLIGKNVSIADISVACILSDVPEEAMPVIKDCPEVDGLIKRVIALPNIKKWVASRPDTPY